jgi:hypothetical protein
MHKRQLRTPWYQHRPSFKSRMAHQLADFRDLALDLKREQVQQKRWRNRHKITREQLFAPYPHPVPPIKQKPKVGTVVPIESLAPKTKRHHLACRKPPR